MDLSLYVITGEAPCRRLPLEQVVEEALRGGATVIQLREKGLPDGRLLEAARSIRQLCWRFSACFLVNDRPDIAWLAQADGVHLGQDDLPVSMTRRLLGKRSVVGLSVDNLAEAREAQGLGVDYIGLGPMGATGTKTDTGPRVTVDALSQIARQVAVPVVAVGGVGSHNARELAAAGARGVAVVTAVVCAPDVAGAARDLRREVAAGRAAIT